MDINEMTIGQAKELAKLFGNGTQESKQQHEFEVGKKYFIRTVTHHYLGECVAVHGLCLVMVSCIWVADDGRFASLMNGEWDNSSEREPYPQKKRVQIFYGGILDASEWDSEIPENQK